MSGFTTLHATCSCGRLKLKCGCGSKPMVPFWSRCTTHVSLFSVAIGMFTGGRDFDPWPCPEIATRTYLRVSSPSFEKQCPQVQAHPQGRLGLQRYIQPTKENCACQHATGPEWCVCSNPHSKDCSTTLVNKVRPSAHTHTHKHAKHLPSSVCKGVSSLLPFRCAPVHLVLEAHGVSGSEECLQLHEWGNPTPS